MNEQEQQQVPVNTQQPVVGGAPDASPNPVTPGSTVTPMTMPSKHSKKMKIVIAAVVLFVILAGGGFAAFYMHMNNKPEKVLADAFTNTVADVLEGKPSTTLGTVSFESKGAEAVNVTVKFDSKTLNESNSGSADVAVKYGGKTFNLKASAAIFGDSEYYFKIENLRKTVDSVVAAQPVFATYTSYAGPIITKLDNKWVKVTKDDLKGLSSANEDTVDKCTAALKNLKLTKPDQKQLKKLFSQNQFIVASENLKTEKVADESSFHYKLDFNNKAAESFAKQVITMESFKTVKTDCEITEKKLEDGFTDENAVAEKDLRNTIGSNEKDTKKEELKPIVELWVGKSTRRPTKFRVSANDKDMNIDFNTQIKLNADTNDVKIEKPTDSISVKEIQAELQKIMPQTTTDL